jgi:hypothetical protein
MSKKKSARVIAKKTKRKIGEPREKPLSLSPLEFEQALAQLLAVKPPKPKEEKMSQ